MSRFTANPIGSRVGRVSMNVLVKVANRNRQQGAVMPYGACMVTEGVAKAGHQVRLLDLVLASPTQRGGGGRRLTK